MKMVICDDEPFAREQIRSYIQNYNQPMLTISMELIRRN